MSMATPGHKPETSGGASADLSLWIGRTFTTTELIGQTLATRMAATLGRPVPPDGAALPPLWQWAYFQDAVAENGLGPDGHPARAPQPELARAATGVHDILPPAAGRQRMWAGGDVEFLAPLRVGQVATRTSTVADVREKHGSTGSLLFVALRHEYTQAGALCIRERQDIVYRSPSPPKLRAETSLPEAQWSQTLYPSAVMLFRYSAVTFNGHRIHYDHPYVTETEGYPGLVVHGPLLATLVCQTFGDAHPDQRITRYTYRGVRPLISPQPIVAAGRITAPGLAQVWAGTAEGAGQMAELQFVAAAV